MKRKVLLLAAALLLLLALFFLWPAPPPPPATPVVTISLTASNGPLKVFPGLGGVLIIPPDGTLWSWGYTGGQSVGPRLPVPTQIGTNADWLMAAAANNHCVALKTNGTLWEWGWRPSGSPTHLPSQVGNETNWLWTGAGDLHAAALRRDGTVWMWGDQSFGQFGGATVSGPGGVVQMGTNSDWTAIGCGQGLHTLGLRADGTLWIWGSVYRFYDRTPGITFIAPVRVCRETNWVGFESGALALARNDKGELWNPLWSPPNPTSSVLNICQLHVDNFQTNRFATSSGWRPKFYLLKDDGTLWTAPYKLSQPVPKASDYRRFHDRSDWVSLWGVSGGTAFGLTKDGTLWRWGADPSQEPVPDFRSRLRIWQSRARVWLGFRPGNLATSATWVTEEEPQPLLRLR